MSYHTYPLYCVHMHFDWGVFPLMSMESDEKKCTSIIKQCIAAAICCVTAFSYGHTIGWSSAALPQLENGGPSMPTGEKGIDSSVSGWIGGSYCLGGLITAPIFGLLADKMGRKSVGYVVGLSFIMHWGFIAFGPSITYIFIGRAIGGSGGAGSITVASIYINEISEDRIRGALCGFIALFYVSGIFFSYILGAFCSFYTIIYIYLVINIIFIVGWWYMPESPAYSVLRGKDERALNDLAWLRSISTEEAIEPLLEIKIQQAGAKKPASIIKFFKNASARRGILLSGILSAIQPFCGIFAIHSYAGSIFSRAGGALDPFISTLIYGLSMCIGGIMPPIFVDKHGRKILLGASSFGLAICMTIMGTYFWYLKKGFIDENNTTLTLLPVITLSICVIVYYTGLGSVIYITMAELFTDEYRGVAGSLFSVVMWCTSFILLQYFTQSVQLFGDHLVFFFFAIVSFFCTVFVYIWIPETKGKNPMDIAEDLVKKR